MTVFLIFISLNLYAQSDTFLTIDQLKTKTVNDLFEKIEGNYQSLQMQMGWSKAEPLENYYLKIDKNHIIWLYQKETQKSNTYSLLYKFSMEIVNNNGILEVKTTPIYTNETGPVFFSNNWLHGIFYISTNYNSIMFGNDIEIDAGPSTTWIRTRLKIK
jgi:hypothetical protein